MMLLSFRLIGKFRDTEYEEYPSKYPEFEFLGQQPPSIVHQYMMASDILIMPSRYENFGLVAVEAMAAGCALVVTKVGKLHPFAELYRPLRVSRTTAWAMESYFTNFLSVTVHFYFQIGFTCV